MGSYAAFYLAGMYPLPATKQMLLSSPYFPKISFFNPLFNTTTTIISHNFQGNPTTGTGGNVFVKVSRQSRLLSEVLLTMSFNVQSVTVNGKPNKSNCFLDWDVFTSGSVVELTLSSDITLGCGNGNDALPPSISTGGYN